ncbi:MAG: hypothetical protein FWE72_09095 [Spirochaetaceae bacterium]|nr:hypothetical protein [Spirochaetaceae bacterium]
MDNKKSSREKLLSVGIIFIFLGITSLLITTGKFTGKELIWPLLPLSLGLFLLYLSFFRAGKDIYILIGMFLSLSGLYLLLRVVILDRFEIERVWPFFMLFTGVSLLLYGFKKKKENRLKFFVPAFAIITLSLFFLPFSLKLFTMKFLTFAVIWWPVIFIAMGAILIIIFIAKRHEQNTKN